MLDARAYEFHGEPDQLQTSVGLVSKDRTVAELGRKAILGADLIDLMDEAMSLIHQVLDADYVGFLRLLPGDREFKLCAGLGFPDGIVGVTRVSAQPGTVPGRVLRSSTPFVMEDFSLLDFPESRILEELRVRTLIGAVIEGRQHPLGVLAVMTTAARHFSEADASFVQLVANVIGAAEAQDEKEEELEEVEDLLVESQKMEAMGRLAGGIAHDFNNLLTVILGSADLALGDVQDEAIRDFLEEIHGAGKRAEVLVDQLLAFGRRQVLHPVVLDPREVIESMRSMLIRVIRSDIRLRVRHEGIGRVRVDRGQLEQVIVNLTVNARDAIPGAGTITIETRDIDLDPASVRVAPNAERVVAPGPYVVVSVSDTGAGMDAATLEACFDPFFTTKKLGEGTGLGLSTVFGVVSQSGGHVSVQSELRRGSTFDVYLPWTSEELAPVVGPDLAVNIPGGSETVLVVEDDVAVRSLTCRSLERYGYAVLSAASGAEALAIMGSHDGRVHLVLTDLVMPEMSGISLVKWVHARSPSVKVLLTSGYPRDGLGEHGELSEEVGFLEKPFGPVQLARAVRQALDGRSATGAVSY